MYIIIIIIIIIIILIIIIIIIIIITTIIILRSWSRCVKCSGCSALYDRQHPTPALYCNNPDIAIIIIIINIIIIIPNIVFIIIINVLYIGNFSSRFKIETSQFSTLEGNLVCFLQSSIIATD